MNPLAHRFLMCATYPLRRALRDDPPQQLPRSALLHFGTRPHKQGDPHRWHGGRAA